MPSRSGVTRASPDAHSIRLVPAPKRKPRRAGLCLQHFIAHSRSGVGGFLGLWLGRTRILLRWGSLGISLLSCRLPALLLLFLGELSPIQPLEFEAHDHLPLWRLELRTALPFCSSEMMLRPPDSGRQ